VFDEALQKTSDSFKLDKDIAELKEWIGVHVGKYALKTRGMKLLHTSMK